MLALLLAVLLPSSLSVSTAAAAQQPALRCEQVNSVVFLGLVPCPHEGAVTREDLERCDLLAQVAVELAVDHINARDDVLPRNISLEVRRLPDVSIAADGADLGLVIHTLSSSHFFGIIGPNSFAAADFLANIFHRADFLTVSYNVTESSLSEIPSFYRTLPSDYTLTLGRLVLLLRNRWFRIATIRSNEYRYAKQAEDFLYAFNSQTQPHDIEVALPTSFTDSPSKSLRQIRDEDINIIMAFFGPRNARNVLCQADSMGLVSPDHAWVLPSYYDPNWWRRRRGSGSVADEGVQCSDEKMVDILESVIFIDAVKYPPVDLPLDEFHRQLIAKSHDLFPSLTEEDLKPYLLRSRATNAYDAVTLLAKSVGVAFDQGGDSCFNSTLVQVALDNLFLECEYCRILSNCILNDTRTSHCTDLCGPHFTPDQQNTENFLNTFTNLSRGDLRPAHLLNDYGQISFSQFIGGEECPIGLLWTSSERERESVDNDSIYTLAELHELPCAVRLGLTKEVLRRNGSQCPLTFQWGDSTEPPSSHFIHNVGASLPEIIFIGLFTGFGLLAAVLFLVFNIASRENKIVKASSPWLNAILLLGIITRLPSSLLESLAISTHIYGFNKDHTCPLCHVSLFLYFTGEVVFITTLIMKNWRIYRIFYNKKLKFNIGNRLSDWWLMLNVLLISLPVVITVIGWMAADNVRLDISIVQSKNFQLLRTATCTSDNFIKFREAVNVYTSILYIFFFVLTFLTLRINMKIFRREGKLSFLAAALVIFPVPIFIVLIGIYSSTMQQGQNPNIDLWIEFVAGGLIPTIVMVLLFLPNVYQVLLKDCFKVRCRYHSIAKSKEDNPPHSDVLTERYHSLKAQAASLRIQLTNTNQQISELSTEEKLTSKSASIPTKLHPPPESDSTHTDFDKATYTESDMN